MPSRHQQSAITDANPDWALLQALLADDLPEGAPRPADLDLLCSLLLSPMAPATARAPRAPAGDRLDALLLGGARIIAGASIILCGFWLANGPVYDWLHPKAARAPAKISRPLSVAAARHPTVASKVAEPLTIPTGTPAPPAVPPGDDFLSPQQIAQHVIAPDDAMPTWLQIPSIGVDTPVVEVTILEDGWQIAEYAAGHLFGTGLPGERGNAVFAGHLGLRGGVFRNLDRLRAGDDVLVYTRSWRFVYRVRSSQVVWPSQVEVLQSGPTATATLITCANLDLQRLVVSADLISAAPISLP
jgi:sortase A